MSTQTLTRRLFILALFIGLFAAFWLASKNHEPDPVVRESYECVASICRVLTGAGDVCVVQKPRITKISIIDKDGAKTVRFTPTNDRCVNGSDN